MTFLISQVVASKHFPSSIRTLSDSASNFLSTVLSHYQSPITIPVIPYRFQNLTHPLFPSIAIISLFSGFFIHVGDSFYPTSLCHDLPNSSNVFSTSVTETFNYDIYDFIELVTINIYFASKQRSLEQHSGMIMLPIFPSSYV